MINISTIFIDKYQKMLPHHRLLGTFSVLDKGRTFDKSILFSL